MDCFACGVHLHKPLYTRYGNNFKGFCFHFCLAPNKAKEHANLCVNCILQCASSSWCLTWKFERMMSNITRISKSCLQISTVIRMCVSKIVSRYNFSHEHSWRCINANISYHHPISWVISLAVLIFTYNTLEFIARRCLRQASVTIIEIFHSEIRSPTLPLAVVMVFATLNFGSHKQFFSCELLCFCGK